MDKPTRLTLDEGLETIIIDECLKHEKQNSRHPEYRACIHIGTDYFVKYGSARDLEPERATQEFIFNYAQQSNAPDTPRIAKVIHHFIHELNMYLVMEHINLEKSPPDLAERIPKALKWLADVPPPSNPTLGPVGGGPIRHSFFKMYKAPFDFPNIEMLDVYAKKAHGLLSIPARSKFPPVSICGERLMFSQSDLDDSNFGVDECGRTVLMDFSEIGLLPESFIKFTLASGNNYGRIAYSDSLAASLGLSSKNWISMREVAYCLTMVSDPRLALRIVRNEG